MCVVVCFAFAISVDYACVREFSCVLGLAGVLEHVCLYVCVNEFVVIMPRCACASKVYCNRFVCLFQL